MNLKHTPRTTLASFLLIAISAVAADDPSDLTHAPYPASTLIKGIAWHWDTRATAAPGSDLWPVAWAPDDHLYTAWGDGGGFGGTDSDGRVALGFGRIEGDPEHFHGVNINGGKNPEHPASYLKKGKTGTLTCVDGTLYAKINLQDGVWPDVNHVLAWSTDKGATWTHADWKFPKGVGNFRPGKFLSFGKDYTGVPAALVGYVYLYGQKQEAARGTATEFFLVRVPKNKIRERGAYEFFQNADGGSPIWTADFSKAHPVFTDPNSANCAGAVYNEALKRYILTSWHDGPGQLGIFEAPNPWGPWSTIVYYETWGRMSAAGEGLSCEFPRKWMSSDGLTMWCVFSAYGESAKTGIDAHDKFNLVKTTLTLKP